MQFDPHRSDWLVACLCAAWCGTCNEYRVVFEAVAKHHPDARFVWVDIEDHADALGEELDIENFPTLLIAHGDAARFFGVVLPHAGTIARTLDAARAADLRSGVPVPGGLVAAVRAVGEVVA
ncbi:thioredoxin family protein [Caldimonas sp. KR1-144]|uniref:thioredoxin family protein n=1 Tax=Caldimonas sp. KR1-144 TaxID=3400911 RepID=UPI003C0CDBDD